MLRILHTTKALQDLDAIWDYIAKDGSKAADNFLDRLEKQFRLLSENPLLGELQPLLTDGTYRAVLSMANT